MGILKRLGSIFGFLKDDPHSAGGGGIGEDDEDRTAERLPRRPTKGFSVQVPVASDKATAGPVLVPCNIGEGGVQGFRWYGRRLRIDEDGDVADEFLNEVPIAAESNSHEQKALPTFEVKYNTRPASVRKQTIAINGNVHPSMEYKGMLRWV